ncbi:nicotinate-nucleotide adenylyltransferase [Glycocaulis sp.]|uniref:nicotinate-nucleotide adenylyltransferase n=1 Tax=Glycocaulis sp. TaxID=1969725 RepID=UPI0025BEAF7D|nr:nicotinate-nucleotide adenylyltransferase [Glycocaulis sp.]MCH8521787.1 nicotinate-nucleotide adenylyltransferase [Glycocaulis sp.]
MMPGHMRYAAAKDEALKPGMTVGLYGGSFDPPHRGHRHVAQTAMKRLGLDRVWWLVSPHNPLKPHAPSDLARRMEAVRALIPEPRHVVTGIEARLGTRYTSELIAHLTARHPGVRFVWIMGADGLGSFHRWQDWRAIAAHVPIVVIARGGQSLKWRLGRASREMAGMRVAAIQARKLARLGAPGWTYITAPLHAEASSDLRRGR